MDGTMHERMPGRYKRLYPGYTTAQLEAAIKDGRGTPQMIEEVAARHDGRSVPFKTPQVAWGDQGRR